MSILLSSTVVYGAKGFILKEINFEGLQRVSVNTALLRIPVSIGDTVYNSDIRKIILSLFSTANFNDIQVFRENNSLTIKVNERKIIANISLIGNKVFKEKQLKQILEGLGLRVGEPINYSILSSIEKGLEDFYYNIGKYNATVKSVVKNKAYNGVDVQLIFREGKKAKIQQINILGNKDYSSKKLRSNFKLHDKSSWWNIINIHSFYKQKLLDDLIGMQDFYLNNGYIRFAINSTQMNLTTDKKYLYISINIHEGQKYKVLNVILNGDLNDYRKEIKKLINISFGELYNKDKIIDIEENIKKTLGNYGYAYPKINIESKINDKYKTVILYMNIDIGQRYYVRKIRFEGNNVSKDELLRREMRQLEGAWLCNNLVDKGKKRLGRTGYFEKVDVDMQSVPGTLDQVDIIYKIKEHNTGNLNFGIGYGSESGLNFLIGAMQYNWLGTGNAIGISSTKNNSQLYTDLSFNNPYITVDGIGFSSKLFINNYKPDTLNVLDYTNQSYGINETFGFPINENNTLRTGLGYVRNNIANMHPQIAIWRYLNSIGYHYGNDYDANKKYDLLTREFIFNYGWIYNNLDRGFFPTSGKYINFSSKFTIPGSDTLFYKNILDIQQYIPLNSDGTWVLLGHGHVGYGNGFYGQEMPFYENFYSNASTNIIRGFSPNAIGPKAIYIQKNKLPNCHKVNKTYFCQSNNAVGGNAIAAASIELIIPTPFMGDGDSNGIRTSIFMDAGTIWDTKWENNIDSYTAKIPDYSDPTNIRVSIGVALQWISPVGPLVFSFAYPLRKLEGDRLEQFQFYIGKNW
ncbi:outer membrane protein assembly factor BamA [Pantoea sp. Aalb]|uniref:outer membrane protein assembly factor BamA n=1 Tax=Pantoea sp. Aalb TaxID=2576762 RepID=UPI0013271C26|nr:outer membrane protein assembly factor BamA [Pantoea sp. Aalb]MXP67223.1 outer membrane protein assembly factor BamA [Pantoea sp. Aalb]